MIRLRSLGDMVLETPAIAALHEWRPDLRISVLAESRCAPALEGHPAVSEVILSRSYLDAASELRRRKFPIVFNQHGGPRSAILAASCGAHWRVGWKGYQFSFLYNVHVPDKQQFFGRPDAHMVEHRISQFYWAGLPRGPIPPARVFPQSDAIRSVARKLQRGGIEPAQPYVVLQPAARLAAMRWPATKFAELARKLRHEHKIATVVNIGPNDTDLAREVRRARGEAILDSLDVRELIALIAGARLFVGNDSGPAHISAGTGCPSVVIFGATNPAEWHPWKVAHRVVHTGAVFKSLRGDKSVVVSQVRSIDQITVDEVDAACGDLLSNGSLRSANSQ
jgi:heptosyltransferase III